MTEELLLEELYQKYVGVTLTGYVHNNSRMTKQRQARLKLLVKEMAFEYGKAKPSFTNKEFNEIIHESRFDEIDGKVKEWCMEMSIPYELVMSRSRKREIVLPRQIIMHKLADELGIDNASYNFIGSYFSKDRATVRHSYLTVEQLIDAKDPLTMFLIEKL